MRKRFLFGLMVCLLISSAGHAQHWQWVNGETCGNGLGDGYICKTDPWSNVYIGGISESTNSMRDSICFGTYTLYTDPQGSQVAIAEYDSAGNLKHVLSSSAGSAYTMNIAIDGAGNVYVYGYFWTSTITFGSHVLSNPYYMHSSLSTSGCCFLVKYDTAGNVVWAKTGANLRPEGYSLSLGSISVDPWCNVYVCGSFVADSINIGPYTLQNTRSNTTDVFLAKYDSSGNVLWARRFGGMDDDLGIGVAANSDGSVYLTGTFYSNTVTFGGTTLNYAIGSAAITTSPDMFIARIDPNGNPVWARSTMGSAAPYDITVDYANHVYVSGQVFDDLLLTFGADTLRNSNLYLSGFLTKFNDAGQVLWDKPFYPIGASISTADVPVICSITIDPCDNVWIEGRIPTNGSVMLDSVTIASGPHGYAWPSMIAGYNADGSLLQYQTFYIQQDDNSAIASDKAGNIYYCGDDGRPVNLGGHTMPSTGASEQMIVAKLVPELDCRQVVAVPDDNRSNTLTIFPNPATTELTVSYAGSFSVYANICIYDLTGRLMHVYLLADKDNKVSVVDLQPGIYLCRINADGQNVVTRRLVVQP